MNCDNCGSSNVWERHSEGDVMIKCHDCKREIENGIVTYEGSKKVKKGWKEK